MRLTLAAAILLAAGTSGFAHRVDEYLQATLLSVEKDRLGAQIRLIPGVAVFPAVLASIDVDGDGLISDTEQNAYAERVLRDLSITIDGHGLQLRLVSTRFARTDELKEGLGEIQLELRADLPPGGPNRRLVLQNHHQNRIAAYLVNSLAPRDLDIRLLAQNRNENQSVYQVDYIQGSGSFGPLSFVSGSSGRLWMAAIALVLLMRLGWLGLARSRRVRAG